MTESGVGDRVIDNDGRKGTRPHQGDSAYIESGVWEYSKSPTGAHYWIITGEMKRCKYCGEERRIPRK